MDTNRNRAEVAFDTLGLVVGTAFSGKPEEALGDSLAGFEADLDEAVIQAHIEDPLAGPLDIVQGATTRFVYDLHAYRRTQEEVQPQPAVAYSLARETHESALEPGQLTRVQHSFTYSDGFGRESQRKVLAEPGPLPDEAAEANPRWAGTGWVILNNKGKPVRQYEPFFSATQRFEFARATGVSSVLFYDPVQRVIGTLQPNHTCKKVAFDPWHQETWDVNDLVLQADPGDDLDAGDFFRRLPEAEYLPTWHEQRKDGALGPAEQDAAAKAAAHAATPTLAFFDTLGRPILTVADNGALGKHSTRVDLDSEGNARRVFDPRGRLIMRYDYDMLGNRIHIASMDAGRRWTLPDASGKPAYSWNSRGHRLRRTYDASQRPSEVFLQEDMGNERLIERTVYGEAQPNAEGDNLRGKVYQIFDAAGVVTNLAFDFKGNLHRSRRQPAADYRTLPDWTAPVNLDGSFTSETTFDALNRPASLTAPDGSVIRPGYNVAGLPERIEGTLSGSGAPTVFVANVDYNARGQRTRVEYGNGVTTTYEYDPLTFRLTRLRTRRNGVALQDLSYAYDPAGNPVSVVDTAQQTVFFNNAAVSPHASYTYDALYRLTAAAGREHIGQVAQPQTAWDDGFRVRLPHPHNGQTMQLYTEQYEYDAAGNILELAHQAASGNWTRSFTYNEPSLLDPATPGDRLTSIQTVGGPAQPHSHDAHGNMTAMPHLPLMRWDHADQLQATSRQVVNDGVPETTYYVYGSGGQRVRKVTERQAASGETPTRLKERFYVGGFEVYREYAGDGATVTLERETLHVVDAGQRLALVESRTQGTDGSPARLIRFQHSNHLGSATLELDGDGQIISYEEYYPHGGSSYQAVRSQTEAPKRYRFTAKERDEETGFYYHSVRYYAPWLGRWTNCDPAGLQGGLNLYEYAKNAATRLVDTSGMAPTIPASGLEVASLEKGLELLNQIVTDQSDFDTVEYFLGERGGKYRVFKLEGNLGGQIPAGQTPIAHTHPGGAMLTFEDVATTSAQAPSVGGARTHLVARGNNNWSIIEVPSSGPITSTDLNVKTGVVSGTIELDPPGTQTTRPIPHRLETHQPQTTQTSVKGYGKLAKALGGSNPLSRVLGALRRGQAAAAGGAAGAAQTGRPTGGGTVRGRIPPGVRGALGTIGMIGLGAIASAITAPIAADILYPDEPGQELLPPHVQRQREEYKEQSAIVAGSFPVVNIPLALLARGMGELWQSVLEPGFVYTPEQLREHTEQGATLNDIREADRATEDFLQGNW
jgi:RHS repeat-associated protein